MRRAKLLAAAITATACVLCGAAELSRARQEEILHAALDAFDRGVGLLRQDAAGAEAAFREAAGGFQALLAAGVVNPAIEYNLGNTHFRLGELGRAIMHYRRAERLAPTHPQVAANLKYARDRVEPLIRESGGEQLVDRLLFWNHTTTMRQRYWLTVLGSVFGWGLLIVWLRVRNNGVFAFAALGIALGLANAGSLAWEMHAQSTNPAAVVVDKPVVLRLGRGEDYDAALSAALGPGVELRILNVSGDWLEVRLPDGQSGWLPRRSVQRV